MKPLVLVVDDDPAVRQSVRKVLEAENYEVLCAANGEEAELLDPRGVDLLLLDIGLPLRGGWDVFERLTVQNPYMAVIIITGRENQFPTAMAAGASALIEKPIDVPALLTTMKELLAEPRDERLHRLAGDCGEPRYVAPDVWLVFENLRQRLEHPFPIQFPENGFGSGGQR